MPTTPYSPPQARVADVAPPPGRWGIRTFWLYLALVLFGPVLLYGIREALWPGLTLASAAAGIALAALLAVEQVRMLVRRSERPSPLWWDALYYGTGAACLAGLWFEMATLALVAVIAVFGVPLPVLVAVWALEARYGVAVYSNARGYHFVSRER